MMSKKDLLRAIWIDIQKRGNKISQDDIYTVVNSLQAVMAEELERGRSVYFPFLGKLVVKIRPPRKATNPITREVVTVPERRGVKFHIAKRLERKLNQ